MSDQSTEMVTTDEIGIDRLTRRPVIERILATHEGARTLALIKATVAVDCTDAEVGHFLELCAAYGLDPFAREAWCAKGKPRNGEPGKLLIMVGRDGLRRIAQRNGLEVAGDVICGKDDFSSDYVQGPGDLVRLNVVPAGTSWTVVVATFNAMGGGSPFHYVTHRKRGVGMGRGPVVGAWSRVTERGGMVERGYFDAPITEYKPANASGYSPWSKQESAMMLGAVERQAIRQATPLGGLMAQGEDESARMLAAAPTSDDPEWEGWRGVSVARAGQLEALVTRAVAVGHAGLADRHTVLMRAQGMSDEQFAGWVGEQFGELEALAAKTTDGTATEDVEPEPMGDAVLTFGGETFTFTDTDVPYQMIMSAMGEGAESMMRVSLDLMAMSDRLAESGDVLGQDVADAEAKRYALLADALRAESEGRGSA